VRRQGRQRRLEAGDDLAVRRVPRKRDAELDGALPQPDGFPNRAVRRDAFAETRGIAPKVSLRIHAAIARRQIDGERAGGADQI